MRALLAVVAALVAMLAARSADAFCGFYVGGAGAKLFNNASIVVLMRDGTRTVLSMQNSYQGPPEKFALVVPVPVVLKKEDVKTLPNAVFDRVDQLAAPRLVEYWEEDPCAGSGFGGGFGRPVMKSARPMDSAAPSAAPPAVRVLAQFVVGEYDIVILGADDSMALDKWLRTEGYQIPADAEPYLRPYVQAGMKFFVAKVDPKKVKFEGGQAMLSPLRFHYDAETFFLPVRLGLANSGGTQDLIVHVLARGQRYEVANYDNVAIPTNLNVSPGARKSFASFYGALFDKTLEKNPGSVVTEYSWDASWCDPCPTPALTPEELAVLGADVLPPATGPAKGFVITRLHARYAKNVSGEDLVFRQAPPIAGGREEWGEHGLETGAQAAPTNTFQGRYAVRYPWTGPINCKNPERGNWGGPPEGLSRSTVTPALKLATAPRGGVSINDLITPPFRAVGLGGGSKLGRGSPADPLGKLRASSASTGTPTATTPPAPGAAPLPNAPSGPGAPPSVAPAPGSGGCAGCAMHPTDVLTEPLLLALAAIAVGLRRRAR